MTMRLLPRKRFLIKRFPALPDFWASRRYWASAMFIGCPHPFPDFMPLDGDTCQRVDTNSYAVPADFQDFNCDGLATQTYHNPIADFSG